MRLSQQMRNPNNGAENAFPVVWERSCIDMEKATRTNLKEVTVMHNYRMLFTALLVMLLTSLCLAAWSQQYLTYSDAELDEILAPVALYPDPLIAQILPAATYPGQLSRAYHLI